MTTVIVDVDDLQTILFATNAIQGVEAALKARERDPLVLSTKGTLSAAHDRLADAWRKSKREAPPEPSERDIEELRRMFSGGQTEAVTTSYPTRLAQTLQLVEAGPVSPGVRIDWPAPASPEFRQSGTSPRDMKYMARLTKHGKRLVCDGEPAQTTQRRLPEPGDYPGGPLVV